MIIALGLLCVTCFLVSSCVRSSICRPQYWEIYKRKEVIGLSMLFMATDISGGVFSILSLAFKEHFDVFASIVYAVVIASYFFFFRWNHESYSFIGYGCGRRRRRSHIEPHREA